MEDNERDPLKEHDQIMKIVDQCAAYLTPDPISGIKRILAEFQGDSQNGKAILGIVALNHPEYSDFIFNYLRVGHLITSKTDPAYQQHLKKFSPFQNMLESQIDLLRVRLYHNEQVQESISDITKTLEDLKHEYAVGEIAHTAQYEVSATIKVFQKKLNRLSDFIHIENEDKVISEMAGLQQIMRILETQVKEYLLR